MTDTHTPLITTAATLTGMISASQQRRINADLDMLIESDRAMTPNVMIAWLVDNYAMSEDEANRAYRAWMADQ